MPGQARGAEPSGGLLGQDRQRDDDVRLARDERWFADAAELGEVGPGEVAEVRAPVEQARETVAGAVEHEGGAAGAQLQEIVETGW